MRVALPGEYHSLREMIADCANLAVGLIECLVALFGLFVLMPLGIALLVCTPPGWIYLWKTWKRIKQEEEEVDPG